LAGDLQRRSGSSEAAPDDRQDGRLMAATGVYKRHRKACRSRSGGRCNCQPSWQAQAFDQHTGKLVTRSFPTEAAAKAWRNDAVTAIRSG
jgi:hypothetical protein